MQLKLTALNRPIGPEVSYTFQKWMYPAGPLATRLADTRDFVLFSKKSTLCTASSSCTKMDVQLLYFNMVVATLYLYM